MRLHTAPITQPQSSLVLTGSHLEIFLSDRSLLPFRDRCKAQQGEDAEECEKYAKYYRSLCPTEWVEKWNEERENRSEELV